MEHANERDIIKDCQKGDLDRFGELYDLYVKKIYNFIYFKTFHKETAEDLTSESFFKALKNIRQFDISMNFSSWIYKIAQNTVIDHYRTFKKQENIDDIWDLEDDDNLIEKMDNKLDFERVKKHLSKLPSIQRDIIMMRVWQDMPYKEIAEVVGKSEENCKVIFSRAITKLRESSLITIIILLTLKI